MLRLCSSAKRSARRASSFASLSLHSPSRISEASVSAQAGICGLSMTLQPITFLMNATPSPCRPSLSVLSYAWPMEPAMKHDSDLREKAERIFYERSREPSPDLRQRRGIAILTIWQRSTLRMNCSGRSGSTKSKMRQLPLL